MKYYGIIFMIETLLGCFYALLLGFNATQLLNGIFMVSLFGLCIGLFLLIFSDGAFSIMGHSFRRFNYVMAPKRMKEAMDEDPLYKKELRIRQDKYAITMPLILISATLVILTLIISIIL